MTPLTLVPILFYLTHASLEGGDSRSLIDYYFDYYNDGASCDRGERSELRSLTNGGTDGLDFLRDLEFECGDNSTCIEDLFLGSGFFDFPCANCFSVFVNEMLNFCEFECFVAESDSLCLDCLEVSSSRDEIEFETCVGLDLLPDALFDACVNQPVVENLVELPLIMQGAFENFCKGDQGGSFVQGAGCLAAEALIDLGVDDEDCADCVGDHAVCVNNFCSSQCSSGDLASCVTCVEDSPCAFEFDFCSGLNLYFRGFGNNNTGDDYDGGNNNTGNYYDDYDDYDFYYYFGGNDGGFFDVVFDIIKDFFHNFIGEFINNLLSILLGQ